MTHMIEQWGLSAADSSVAPRVGWWLCRWLPARQILLNVSVDVLLLSLIFCRAFLNQGDCFASHLSWSVTRLLRTCKDNEKCQLTSQKVCCGEVSTESPVTQLEFDAAPIHENYMLFFWATFRKPSYVMVGRAGCLLGWTVNNFAIAMSVSTMPKTLLKIESKHAMN
jgi:hypothetical protein